MQVPLIIGHRGASALRPENTIAAFDLAVDSGADGIEFDVRLARDGVPVVIHDADLQRTSGRPGRVAEMSSLELAEVDIGSWFNQKYPKLAVTDNTNARLVTLRAVLERFRKSSPLFYVELKCSIEESFPLASTVVRLIREFSIHDHVVVECFDLSTILHVKKLDSSIKTAALFEPKLSLDFFSRKRLPAMALAAGANQMALHHSLVTASRVKRAETLGIQTIAWTVDNPRWVTRAVNLGLTALITNDPAKMLKVRDQLSRNVSLTSDL